MAATSSSRSGRGVARQPEKKLNKEEEKNSSGRDLYPIAVLFSIYSSELGSIRALLPLSSRSVGPMTHASLFIPVMNSRALCLYFFSFCPARQLSSRPYIFSNNTAVSSSSPKFSLL